MGLSTLDVFEDANQFRLLMSFYAVIEESGVVPNCESAPELFFPEKINSKDFGDILSDTNLAKTACKTCPLLDACATYAIVGHERDGIWGGLTANERNSLRKEIIRNKGTADFTKKGYLGYYGIKAKVEQVPRSVSEM
jgi:WhiB family redox-sensing transcriptional regulator